MLNPKKKYNLEYYLGVVEKLVGMGIHILGLKDVSSHYPNHYQKPFRDAD